MPEKSGLPSAVRGVGADRLGFPFAVLGTPAVGYFSHWATTGADQLRAEPTANAATAERTIDVRMRDLPKKIRLDVLRLSRPCGRLSGEIASCSLILYKSSG